MKKVFYPLACLCIVSILFTGCSKNEKKDSSTSKGKGGVVEGVDDEFSEYIIGEGVYYEIKDDKYVAVMGYEEETETVEIPDAISYEKKEYPVEAIAEEAFSGNTTLRSITLPESLRTISTEAFSGCIALQSLDIPAGVSVLGNGVFYDCMELTSCVIGAGITSLPNELFTNCYALKSVELPDSLVSIGSETFWSCEALEELQLPESVVSIGERAFYGTGIRKLTIPSVSVTPTEETVDGLYNLEELYVDEQQMSIYGDLLAHMDVKIQAVEK